MMKRSIECFKQQASRLGIDASGYEDISILITAVVGELRSRPEAGSLTLMKKCYTKVPGGARNETTLYEYYNEMIKDTVRQARLARGKAYIFTLEQVWDVLKREKNAQFRYLPDSDCIEVTRG